MTRTKIYYCIGRIPCSHWGQIPQEFDELTQWLQCPECLAVMGPVPGHPHDAGYHGSTQVTPRLRSTKELE